MRGEGLHKGFDRKARSYVIDEGSVRRRLRDDFDNHQETGIVLETHLVNSILPRTRGVVALVLRLDPVILAKRLRARNWSKLKIWENVESEMIGVSLYDSLKVLGKRRVLEIDTTGKRPNELLREVFKVLSTNKGWSRKSSPDWLKKYDPILLSKKIL